MREGKTQEAASLGDVLIDGFEKNEIFAGFHWRDLPMPDEDAAHRKFAALTDEARRWKGVPIRMQDDNGRRIAAWADLEIRQVGRGVRVCVRAPWFDNWWHEKHTWQGNPMGPMNAWLNEESSAAER